MLNPTLTINVRAMNTRQGWGNSDPQDGAAAAVRESHDDVEGRITLGLLNMIHDSSSISQRAVASQLGIALGLTNSYLRRCIKKGLIKVQQVPANRYLYYLTPQGFAEKSRLTSRYLTISFRFYRSARGECQRLLDDCAALGWRTIALYGSGVFTEIFSVCRLENDVVIAGVVDKDGERAQENGGFPVRVALSDFEGVDAVIVCRMEDPQAAYDEVSRIFPAERILAPTFLHISRLQIA